MSESRVGRPRTIDPEAVSLTALRLFDDKGYDAVSMEDVAVAAKVSRRYLFRLFPTKASLLWGGLDEFIDRLHDFLGASPEDVSASSVLAAAYRHAATFPAEAIEVTRHRLRVIAANPELAGEGALRVATVTRDVVAFITARDGVRSDGLRETVVANALASAASAALTWWALSSEDSPEEAVARAVDLVVTALS
jgi:AcrR family transcriptional regulator